MYNNTNTNILKERKPMKRYYRYFHRELFSSVVTRFSSYSGGRVVSKPLRVACTFLKANATPDKGNKRGASLLSLAYMSHQTCEEFSSLRETLKPRGNINKRKEGVLSKIFRIFILTKKGLFESKQKNINN